MALKITIKKETSGLVQLGRIFKEPFAQARGRRSIRAVRRVAAREFARGGGFSPSGAFNPWKRTQPFGDRPAPSVPLGGSGGSLARAWGGGAGGFSFVRGKRIVLGVTLPYAAVHRGGTEAPSKRVTVIKAKRFTSSGQALMRLKFISAFGVFVSEAKVRSGMRIPGRPHVDLRAPQYKKAMASGIVGAISEALS